MEYVEAIDFGIYYVLRSKVPWKERKEHVKLANQYKKKQKI